MLKPFTGKITLNPDGRPIPVVERLMAPPVIEQQPVEPQGRSIVRTIADLGLGAASGTAGLVGDVAQAANTVSGGAIDRLIAPAERIVTGAPARGVAQLQQAAQQAISSGLSEDIAARQQNLQQQKGPIAPAATLLSDPGLAAQFLAEQFPILLALGKTSRSAARSARAASLEGAAKISAQRPVRAGAAERLAERAAENASQQSVIAASSVLGGGSAANQASQEVSALPIETLRNNPEFVARASVIGEDAARAELAQGAALRALAIAAPSAAIASKIAAPFESKLFRGQLGGGGLKDRLRTIGTGVAREVTEESLQEGSEQIAQNIGVQSADPTVGTFRGVPEAASIGGVLGGLFGAAGGALGGAVRSDAPTAQEPSADPNASTPIDSAVQTAGPSVQPLEPSAQAVDSAQVAEAPVKPPLEAAADIATGVNPAAVSVDSGPATRAFADAQIKEVARGGDLVAKAEQGRQEAVKDEILKAAKKAETQSAQIAALGGKAGAPSTPAKAESASAQTSQPTAVATVDAQNQPAPQSAPALPVGEVRKVGGASVTLTPIASDPIVATEPLSKDTLAILRAATSLTGGAVNAIAQNNVTAPTGAIGGGGVRVNLRGPAVSATQIPTTTDVRQFGLNFVGPQSIESVVVAKGVRILPAERKILTDAFTATVDQNGSTVYTPKASTVQQAAAPAQQAAGPAQQVAAPAQTPVPTQPAVSTPASRKAARIAAEQNAAVGSNNGQTNFASENNVLAGNTVDSANPNQETVAAQSTASKSVVRRVAALQGKTQASAAPKSTATDNAAVQRKASVPGALAATAPIEKQGVRTASTSTVKDSLTVGGKVKSAPKAKTEKKTVAKTPGAKTATVEETAKIPATTKAAKLPKATTVAEKVADSVTPPQAPTRTQGASIADPDVKVTPSNAANLNEHIARIVSQWRGDVPAVKVVQSVTDLPLRAQRGNEFNRAEGWYDGATVYLVADNIPTALRAEQVLAHEAFGHFGVDGVFGRAEWDGIIAQVGKIRSGEANASGPLQSALQATRRRYPNASRETFAREFIAVMAERNIRASPFGRVLAAVRAFLRLLGFNPNSWAEADLRSVVSAGMRRVQNAQKVRVATVNAATEGAFSVMDPNVAFNTLADALAPEQGLARRLLNKTSDLTAVGLKALTLRQLTEVASDRLLPNAKRYQRSVDDMKVRRISLQNKPAELVKRFASMQSDAYRKMRREGKQLSDADVMANVAHDATIAGVDPAQAFVAGVVSLEHDGAKVDATPESVGKAVEDLKALLDDKATEAEQIPIIKSDIARLKAALAAEPKRIADHAALVPRFNAMPKAWQQLYKDVRDQYAARADETMQSILDRIDRMDLSDTVKKNTAIRARARFESARITAPYFPLARFGEYWASLTSPEGEAHFIMAETKTERDAELSKLAAKGFKFNKAGVHLDSSFAVDQTSGTFVSDVVAMLDKNGVDSKIQDEVYQMFLRHLPDLSARKSFIHRKKIAGYSSDMLRAFAGQMNHSAFQLARLEFNDRLDSALTAVKADAKAANAVSADDGSLADRLVNELNRRHDWVLHPTHNKSVQALQSANFVFYLGLAPASAIVNLSQNALVTYPALAARYGVVAASKHMMSAFWSSISTGGNIESTQLSPDERAAMQQLIQLGARDQTLGHDLAGIGDNDTRDYNPLGSKTMHLMSSLFHRAEVINRESSGLAAYRLAREAGKGHDAAVLEAADTIWSTHFDFSNENRAAFMQSNTGKVVFAFKQYSQGMTYFLGRALFQSISGATPEIKREARRRITGTLFMTGVFSGVLGMPAMSVILGTMNAMASAFGDDDDPFDAETELRNFFSDMLGFGGKLIGGAEGEKIGRSAESALSRGPIEALTGIGIAGRTGLSELWFRDPNRELEGRALGDHIMEQVAGPIGAIALNLFEAGSTIHEGFATGNNQMMIRGLESAMPTAVKSAMRAGRFAIDGAKTLRGDPLIDDVNWREILFQFTGFSPARINAIYDVNNAKKGVEEALIKRKSTLIDAYALTLKFRDREGQRNVIEKIKKFNATNPTIAITMSTIRRAMTSRQNFSEKASGGVVVNPRLQGRIDDKVRFGQ